MSAALVGFLGSVALTWTAPSECPTREAVLREIADAGSTAREVVATATIEEVDDGVWRLDLHTGIGGGTGHRQLESSSCAELAEATALILALEAGADDRALSPGTVVRAASPATREADDIARFPEKSPSPRFALGIAGGLAVGALADPSYGVSAAASWLPGRSRLAIEGTYFPPVRIDGRPREVAGRFDLVTVGATACHALVADRVELAPCAGIEVGRIGAEGRGARVAEPIDTAALWVALRAGGSIAYRMGRFALRVDLGAAMPLIRNRFLILGVDEVHRPDAVGVRGLVGIERRFP